MSFSAMVKEELFNKMTGPRADRIGSSRASLRRAFMESGSVSDPLSSYHLEISGKTREEAEALRKLMEGCGLSPGIVARKGRYVVYLKEAEQISTMLGLMGAPGALMEFENSRILREISGDVNRKVNCETANIGKAVSTGVRQIESIRMIRDTVGLEALPPPLREIALVRLENPEVPLRELGALLDPPLGKSGTNHRLKKIEEFAERLRISEAPRP